MVNGEQSLFIFERQPNLVMVYGIVDENSEPATPQCD